MSKKTTLSIAKELGVKVAPYALIAAMGLGWAVACDKLTNQRPSSQPNELAIEWAQKLDKFADTIAQK